MISRRIRHGLLVAGLSIGVAALPASPAEAQLDEYPPDWNYQCEVYSMQGTPTGMHNFFIEGNVPVDPVGSGQEFVLSEVVIALQWQAFPATEAELTLLDQVLEFGGGAFADPNHDPAFNVGPIMWGPMEFVLVAPEEPGEYVLDPEELFLAAGFTSTCRDFEREGDPFGVLVVEESTDPDNGTGNGNGPNGTGENGDGENGDPGDSEDPTVRTEVRRVQQDAAVAAPRFTG